MTRVSEMFKRLLDADTQALVEAGFLSENLELTDCGKGQLVALLFAANKDALVILAKAKLAEAKNK